MKAGSYFQTSLVVVVVILVVIAGADAKKRNKKHPPDSPGRLKDASRKGSNSSPEAHDTVPGQDSESTTVAPAKDVPQADPAVAPDVEAPPSKQKGKHRNRGGRRNRDQPDAAESSDAVTKEVKDKANRKKDRSEKKKHHKKHNREDMITTTTVSMNGDMNELPDPVAENEPTIMETTAETVVDGDPLVEPEVELDEGVEATMITTTTTTISSKKHNRDRGGKRMRDQAQTEREARKVRKEQKKMDKQEKRKHRKHNSDPADDVELTVNPTPSPAADGIKLTPSGPSPLQTTQQQPTQTEQDTNRKEKKKNKKQKLAEETELSKTEKQIQRLQRKMQRMGNKGRKNATRIPCDDHENCQEGQCCLLRRGKKVCHVINKPEGHHCVHPCMCSEGLTCLGKNRKQKSLSKGHCRRVDITETVGEGAVADNQAPTTVDNELPQ